MLGDAVLQLLGNIMRMSEERYNRDLRRLNLAGKLLRYEVRTGLILLWTNLPERRLRALRSHAHNWGVASAVTRHRGPPPTDTSIFFRSLALRSEAAAVAVLCQSHQVLASERGPQAVKKLPSLVRGERLCRAYEVYREMVPQPVYTLDQILMLLDALVLGEIIELGICGGCTGAILIDRLRHDRRVCASCYGSLKQIRRQDFNESGIKSLPETSPGDALQVQGCLF